MSTHRIRALTLSCIAALFTLFSTPIVPRAGATPPSGYSLVWSDGFDPPGTTLDPSKWDHFSPGVRYNGYDVPDAVSLDGQGNLVVSTYMDYNFLPLDPHRYRTGSIATKRVAKYGYIEARVMFTGAPSVWSSYWFQSPTFGGVPPYDPRSAGTEIDVIEHLYNSPDAPSALHWDAYCQRHSNDPPDPNPKSAGSAKHSGAGGTSLASGFHTYGLEWTPDVLKVTYDDLVVWTVDNAPNTVTDPPSQITCPWSDPGPLPPSFVGPVSRAGEYIILNNEVRSDTDHPLDPATDYGPKNDPGNPKMTVDYVSWYEPLPAPSGLTATPVSPTQINLAWTDNSYAEDNFKVERSTDNVNFSEIATLAANTQSYQNTGLSNGTRYYYRVRASAGTGNGAYSSTANAMTYDVIRPNTITDLWVPSIGMTTIAVAWSAPGDDGYTGTATQYDLRYSTSFITAANFASATPFPTGVPHVPGSVECCRVSGLSPCVTYYFAIEATDDAGNTSFISNVPHAKTECTRTIVADCVQDPDVIPPARISNLLVSNTGKNSMALTWTAPGDDSTFGTAVQYDLRYSTSSISDQNFASATPYTIGQPNTAGYSECRLMTNLGCGTFFVAIKAKDDAGNWSVISNFPNAAVVPCTGGIAFCGQGAAKLPVPMGEGSLSFSRPSPNPARGTMGFQISVPGNLQGTKLRVDVFDVAGRRVRSLVNRIASQGTAPIEWNLLNDSGRRVASGLYRVRVDVGDTRKTFPLLVLR